VSSQHAPVVFDTLSHPRRQRVLGVTPVVGHLQVHPEFRRRFENVPSRIAVSPVMPLSSFRIAVIRLGDTPIAFASAFAVRPISTLEFSSLRAHDHSSAAALHRGILSEVVVNFLLQSRPPVYRLAGDADCSSFWPQL